MTIREIGERFEQFFLEVIREAKEQSDFVIFVSPVSL